MTASAPCSRSKAPPEPSSSATAALRWAVTEIVHSWDDAKQRYENGNVQMYLDGTWQPMHDDFFSKNQDEFDTTDYPNSCPGGLSSDFAGEADFALDHTDNAPEGAEGFQSTRNWYLADCANIQVGGPQDPDKKYAEPADILWTCTPDNNDGDIDVVVLTAARLGRARLIDNVQCRATGAIGSG